MELLNDLKKQEKRLTGQKLSITEEEVVDYRPARIDLERRGGGASDQHARDAADVPLIAATVFFLEGGFMARKWVGRNIFVNATLCQEIATSGERRDLFALRQVYEVCTPSFARVPRVYPLSCGLWTFPCLRQADSHLPGAKGEPPRFTLGTDDQVVYEAILARLYAKCKFASGGPMSPLAARAA
eukprot:tig00000403_g300.t1